MSFNFQFNFINIVSVTNEIVPENLQPEFYMSNSGFLPVNRKKPQLGQRMRRTDVHENNLFTEDENREK